MIQIRERISVSLTGLLLILAALTASAQPAELRREDFTIDPSWESYRNHLVPDPPRTTRQHFGYQRTQHAHGAQPGEIGGWVQRSVTPAWYAKVLPTKTLTNRLSASGKFAVSRADGGGGTLFGWFNSESHGWRTPNSLVFRFDGNGGRFWVFYEYGTRNWLTGGGGCFEGPQYQSTKTKPLLSDGTVHHWALDYDPDGANGRGIMTFVLDGRAYSQPLAEGHKADGATFDRFGIFNQQISGKGMEVSFADLVIDGQRQNFSNDPNWEGHGNQTEFPDRAVRPLHDFGFSRTAHAGGQTGEIGGIIWRDERPAYYADRIELLTLSDELFASGKLAFVDAGSDSAAYIGWFNSHSKTNKATADHEHEPQNILGILIEGPSRIGHYFRPVYSNAAGQGGLPPSGPIIRPDGRRHTWSMHYAPEAAGGRGEITVRFDEHTQTLSLKPGEKNAGAIFDRFGLFNHQAGGHFVEIYLDEIAYTARPSLRR